MGSEGREKKNENISGYLQFPQHSLHKMKS